jgi:hypothetical protein
MFLMVFRPWRLILRPHFAVALLFVFGVAISAPPPRPKPPTVKRVTLPEGNVTFQNVKTKEGILIRATAGTVVVQGKQLYYGDDKIAMLIRATEKGTEFVYGWGLEGEWEGSGNHDFGGKWITIDGTSTDKPGLTRYIVPESPKAEKLEAGSVYLVTPSVKFVAKEKPKARP